MKHLYTGLARPHLEFENVIWHTQFKKDNDILGSVQLLFSINGMAAIGRVDHTLPSLTAA